MNICLVFVKTVLSVKNVCVWLGSDLAKFIVSTQSSVCRFDMANFAANSQTKSPMVVLVMSQIFNFQSPSGTNFSSSKPLV